MTAILGVIFSVSVVNYQQFRIQSLVREATQQVVADITKERFASQTRNEERSIQIDTDNANTYSLSGISKQLPKGIELVKAGRSSSVTFYPPYGTTGAAERSFQVVWANNPTRHYQYIRVVGVTGKVIIQAN